jgi:hypothetical protein
MRFTDDIFEVFFLFLTDIHILDHFIELSLFSLLFLSLLLRIDLRVYKLIILSKSKLTILISSTSIYLVIVS